MRIAGFFAMSADSKFACDRLITREYLTGKAATAFPVF